MSTNDKHWITVTSVEMLEILPIGTTHPRVVSGYGVKGFYMWNPEMTKMYGPYDTFDEVLYVIGAIQTNPTQCQPSQLTTV